MSITYRMLPQEEWKRLEPLYFELFPASPIPSPELSAVAVAEDNGEIVGFWFMMTCAHMEPAGLNPAYMDQVSLHSLRDELHKAFSYIPGMEYYVTAVSPKLEAAMLANGFNKLGISMVGHVPVME